MYYLATNVLHKLDSLYQRGDMSRNVWKSVFVCEPSEDSEQPAHSHSLIRIFTGRILGCCVSMRIIKTLIRFRAVWFEFSLGVSGGTISYVVARMFIVNLPLQTGQHSSCIWITSLSSHSNFGHVDLGSWRSHTIIPFWRMTNINAI